MPIYEYRCASCGHEVEALQKLTDPPLTECPSCHKQELRKQVSAAGFQLKGSGWYVTDFRNKGGKTASKDKAGDADAATKVNGSESTSGAAGAEATKTETKGTEKTSTSTESKSTPSSSTSKTES